MSRRSQKRSRATVTTAKTTKQRKITMAQCWKLYILNTLFVVAALTLLCGCSADIEPSGDETPKDKFTKTTKPIAKTSKLKPKNGSTTIRPLSAESPEMVYDEYMEVYPEADTNIYDDARQIKISVF